MTLLEKTITSDNYSQNQGYIPLKTIGMEIKVNKNYLSRLCTKRLEFHLTL